MRRKSLWYSVCTFAGKYTDYVHFNYSNSMVLNLCMHCRCFEALPIKAVLSSPINRTIEQQCC